MRNINLLFKRIACVIITCALIFTGVGFTKADLFTPTTNVNIASAATSNAYVYYKSNGALYRVMNDGTNGQKLLSSFSGVNLKPVGNYLYYIYDEKSTTLLSLPMDGSAKMATRFIDDEIIYYDTDGQNIYYMNDAGEIYTSPANAKSTEAKLVTDMADTNYPRFSIVNGRIYYNALKSGRTTWVASKAADGSGQIQWIAAGAIPSQRLINKDNTNLNFIVDTKPYESKSTKCMILYSIPLKGGATKAINAKAPLDANAVYAGMWTKGYYIYNNGILYDSNGEKNYSKSKGCAIDLKGKTIQLHTKGIVEITDFGAGKLAFVDSDYKGYVSTIASGKATTKSVSIKDAWYIRNLASSGNSGATVIFAESGAYTLQPNLSLKKLVGIEWEECMYDNEVEGLFYVNAGDNKRLYYMGSDGKTTTKLSDEKNVSGIELISKY